MNIIDKNIYSGNLLDKLTDHVPNSVVTENMNKKTSKRKNYNKRYDTVYFGKMSGRSQRTRFVPSTIIQQY